MYREVPFYTALINASIVANSTGAKAIITTDPNMRFELYDCITEVVSLSGVTSAPTAMSVGVVAATYVDQVAAITMAGLTTVNRFVSSAAGGAAALSIAPSTTIFLNITTAAVATTYNIRVILCGVYY